MEKTLKKNLLVPLIIAVILSSLFTNKVHALGEVNLALGSTAFASYHFLDVPDIPSYAVDGNLNISPRWTTYTTSSTSAWFELNFSTVKTFNEVKLYIYNDNGGVKIPASYTIQYWTGSTWENVPGQIKTPLTPGAGLNTVKFNAITRQELRINFESGPITTGGQGVGLYELEVYMRIDTTAPVIDGVADEGSYNTVVNPTFNEGTATLNGNPFLSGGEVTADGTYELIVTDAAGNISMVHFIVDRTAPAAAAFAASSTDPTYGLVRVSISYPTDAQWREYRVGSGYWQSYTDPIDIISNDTVYARSVDVAGNVSVGSSYEVHNIDPIGNNGLIQIKDIVQVLATGTSQQKDMNGNGEFEHEDILIMLQLITPIVAPIPEYGGCSISVQSC